jgi:Flp pilus assembly protein TadG
MSSKLGFFSLLSRLDKDERGTILVQFTVYLVAVFGFIGLTLDGGRYLLLHNSLQDLSDAAALAGAAKLDGTSGAIARATAAAQAMADNNPPRWYDVGGSTSIGTPVFYSSLNPDTATTSDKDAKYIKVTTDVTAAGVSKVVPTFLIAVGAVSQPASAAAMAKATGSQCFATSMMLCNPSEPRTGSTGDTSSFDPPVGAEFIFSVAGNTGAFSPGVFNLLDTPEGSGSDVEIKKFLSQQTPQFCFTGGTSPAQGQKTNATIVGINVRFDQQPNGNTSGLDLTPAPIKISGQANPANKQGRVNCNQQNDVSAQSFPLPHDRSFTPPTMSQGGSQQGSGPTLADLQAYWSNHHPGSLPADVTTRWQIYQLEVTGSGDAGIWKTDAVEPHGPVCAPTNTEVAPEFAAGRRLLKVAVVDCLYWGVHGNAVNNIPITTYADFFLIRPSDGNIYTEYVGKNQINGGNSLLRLIVQLVR